VLYGEFTSYGDRFFMATESSESSPLRLSPRITILPIVHGCVQSALAVRTKLLELSPDCLAVALPASFAEQIEEGIVNLPRPSIVVQRSGSMFDNAGYNHASYASGELEADDIDDLEGLYSDDGVSPKDPIADELAREIDGAPNLPFDDPSLSNEPADGHALEADSGATYAPKWQPEIDEDETPDVNCTYVPIDPCQAVIAAIRSAIGEHIPRRYIDMETLELEPMVETMPDPYALKTLSLDRFCTAALMTVGRPQSEQAVRRMRYMGLRLRQLEAEFENIVFVCSIQQWPWIREAYSDPQSQLPEGDDTDEPTTYLVDDRSLMFLFGELPFITGLYERARMEWSDDADVSLDGFKELLITTREKYLADLGKRARRITPKLLGQCLKYTRNLTLMERRLRPDLFSIATAAQQILGDQFTVHLVETARDYLDSSALPDDDGRYEYVTLGIDQIRLPNGEIANLINRLPGNPTMWRTLDIRRRPDPIEIEDWQSRWNPLGQCSWPPEDTMIETFRSRVFDSAKAIMGADLAQSEKFSTSMKDGLDIRETLRHWYDGDIYVKVNPPTVGNLDAAVMLFDSPADPRDYSWRATWFAEHHNESTLAFFATDYRQEIIGPGIASSTYGGAMFLFPPRPIADIWNDPRLNFVETLEERLLASACLYSQSRQVALLSWLPPGAGWRRLAKRFKKTLVHIPMGSFNESMVQQMRSFHVLNGQQIRSFAADFIRKP
jgi:hypothetical protein